MIALALLLAAAIEYSAPLKQFVGAVGKDGKPVLTQGQLHTLDGLPEHTRELLSTAIDNQIIGSAKHLGILLSVDMPAQSLALVAQDNCVLCHTDPGNVKARSLFSPDPKVSNSNPLLNLTEFVNDTHFRQGLSCSGCHGGTPKDESMANEIAQRWPSDPGLRHADRTWIPGFCARCHSDPAFMRGFSPAMPTDQLVKYQQSKHGTLLLGEHDSKAAQCVSCHGVHGIRGAKSRNSKVYAQRIPETCGTCHADAQYMAGYKNVNGDPLPTNQLAQYKLSVHGKALLEKGDLGAPACNGCHGNHGNNVAATAVAVASFSQACRTCHPTNASLFEASKHKKAFDEHQWPACEQCHGRHQIMKPTDALLANEPGALCFDCHAKYSKENLACGKTAAHFKGALTQLGEGKAELSGTVEHLAEAGLDVEPLTGVIGELSEAVVQTRTRVHSFDQGTFDSAATPGLETLARGRKLVADARAEHGFRRKGLLMAIGSLLLLASGLAFKIRGLGSRASDDEKRP